MSYIRAVSGNVSSFDGRIFDYDFAPIKMPYIDMLTISNQREKIYNAVHVGTSFKNPVFEASSKAVAGGYRSSNLVDYSWYYNYLLSENHPLIVMAGEFDMRDGVQGQYKWMKQLLNVSEEFWETDRRIYFYQDGQNHTKVGGYWSQEGNFTLGAVPKSGHFLPHDNYLASKHIVDDYVNNGSLQCKSPDPSLTDANCRVVDYMCKAMNNCSGHGNCTQHGQCSCDVGFKGADCSYKAYTKEGG